jgi:zinc and cadmium transporter
LNFLSALVAILGVIIVFIFGRIAESFALWVLPIAAGGFIYVAMADLIPELHKTKKIAYSLLQFAVMLIGILAMVALVVLE